MILDKRVLAIIPARGGSKGVKRKNIRDLGGKPLLAWTIEAAKRSKYIDRLVLSSEDEEIMAVAKEWGCEVPFVRPGGLAQDDTPGTETVSHALQQIDEEFDIVLVLQPTSPLRNAEDIDGAIDFFLQSNAPACVSVAELDKNPCWMYRLDSDQILQPLFSEQEFVLLRQKSEKSYFLNGAIYLAKIDWYREQKAFLVPETVGYVMPGVRSLDIDTESDLELAQFYMHRNGEL